MTIDDLFVMFAEKRFRKSVNIIANKMSSFVFRQINITSYFKSVSSSKIKSFKSDVFTSSLSSTSNKFASVNHIARTSHCHMPASKCPVLTASLRFFHICRFCHETFRFNNDLHRHLRMIHLTSRSKQPPEDCSSALHGRNIDINSLFFADKRPSINNSSSSAYRSHGALFESIE